MDKPTNTCPKCFAEMKLNSAGITPGSSSTISGMISDSGGSTSPEYVGGTWICKQCGYFETDSLEPEFFS